MILKDIIARCSQLAINATRSIGDDYSELVFYSKDIEQWHALFVEMLGPAIKPQGYQPTQAIMDLTEEYGGICEDQTLFKREFDDAIILAMFWPWKNGEYTTLRVLFLDKNTLTKE